MTQPFDELRERLLRAGVAPRHVRRYLGELTDHLADLRAEEERAGRSREEAESAALARLGRVNDLAQAVLKQRQFQSWCARAPWAMFSLAPLFFLAAAYFVACVYLWCGWNLFLPAADTPFSTHLPGSIYSLTNIYFQAGKYYYICAPVLVGWGIGIVAGRQRLKAIWPTMAFLLIAWMGATAQIQASRTAVPGLGHISMRFFVLGPSGQIAGVVFGAVVVFSLTALPYLIWRLRKMHSFFV